MTDADAPKGKTRPVGAEAPPPLPEGLEEHHRRPPRGFARHASPLSLILLGLLMAAALSGQLGGAPKPILTRDTAAARLEVQAPHIIRNGEFFETQIVVVPHRPFEDLVIGVTPSLWRDITINTMIPAPAEERLAPDAFLFSYGKAEAGRALTIKIDGQINPSRLGGTEGRVTLLDGEVPIAEIPIRTRILP